MADEVIHATSEEPSAEDTRLRTLVTDLISQQNKAMIDLAKSMLTITFTAIGVVLALQENWFGGSEQTGAARGLVVGALVALFLSVPVYLTVIRGYRMSVSTTDYQLVEDELSRLATLRSRLVNAGMALTGLAAVLLAIAIV
jgi:hypothetical protein